LLGGTSVAVVALAARSALSTREIVWAIAATAIILFGAALAFALGSAWDADLELEIEPGLRGFVQETAPTTTVRMVLFLAASGLAALQVALLARLSPGVGL